MCERGHTHTHTLTHPEPRRTTVAGRRAKNLMRRTSLVKVNLDLGQGQTRQSRRRCECVSADEKSSLCAWMSPRSSVNCAKPNRDWYFIAEQPAPAPHLAHPEGCAALRIVLATVPRVSRSCEHFPNGFDLHLLHQTKHPQHSHTFLATTRAF